MKNNKKSNLALIGVFLRGCTHLFLVCIIASLLSSLCELIMPKIISFTVDSVIGDEAINLPAPLMSLIDKVGGIEYLRDNLWIFAALILLFAVLMGIFKYLLTLCEFK